MVWIQVCLPNFIILWFFQFKSIFSINSLRIPHVNLCIRFISAPPILPLHPAPRPYSPTLYPHFLLSNSHFTFYLQQIISLKKKRLTSRAFLYKGGRSNGFASSNPTALQGKSKTSQGNLVILCLEKNSKVIFIFKSAGNNSEIECLFSMQQALGKFFSNTCTHTETHEKWCLYI